MDPLEIEAGFAIEERYERLNRSSVSNNRYHLSPSKRDTKDLMNILEFHEDYY